MDDDGDDLTAIAWPGFVDILSAVIIMFVFFTMIIASALYFHTIIFKSKLIEEANKSQSSEISEQVEELTQEKQSLEDQVANLNEKINQVYANLAQSVEQRTIVSEDENQIVIFFSDKAITVTQDTKDQIEAFLAKHKELAGGRPMRAIIDAGKNPAAPTESLARTVAFARLFNVRNVLLTEQTDPGSISVNLVPPEEIEESYHWVRLRIEK